MLRENVPLGLVTGASKIRLDATLSTDFMSYFGVIVTGEQNIRPKPSPDPYLKAVRELGMPPLCSIAVENAPLGIRSAKSAGLYCLAISSTLDSKFLSEADVVVKNLYEAGEWMQSKIESGELRVK